MDLGLIRNDSPQPLPATPPPQTSEDNSASGWSLWSAITKTAATVTSYVKGAAADSESDENQTTMTTAKVTKTIPAMYLDRASEPDTHKPVDTDEYRPIFIRAGSNDNDGYPGFYLPNPIRDAAMNAYRRLSRNNEKAFLTELTALEPELQFAATKHIRDEAEVRELKMAMEAKQTELKTKKEEAAAQGREFDTFWINFDITKLADRLKTMERKIKEEKALLKEVTACLDNHGSVDARTAAAEQFCTEQDLKAAMSDLIKKQNMVTDSWARTPKQVFNKSRMSPAEQQFYELLQSDKTSLSELMSGFVENISAMQKYKNSVTDLESLLSVFERFCFVMVATHKDQQEYKGGMQRFRDFNEQLKADIATARSYEKHRIKTGRRDVQQLAALGNAEDKSKKLNTKAAELLKAITGFLQENEPAPEEPVCLAPVEQALHQALDSDAPDWREILPLFFNKVLPMDKYAGAGVSELLKIFTDFMDIYEGVHVLTDSAGKSTYDTLSLHQDMSRLHLSVTEKYAPAIGSAEQEVTTDQ